MKILIIDDEWLISRSLFRVAKTRGHQGQIAQNGWQGVKLWQSFKPDVTFLDVFIPQLNGPDILSIIKKTPSEKIIMISAHQPLSGDQKNLPENFNSALRNVDLFISKPFEDVWKVIERAEQLYQSNFCPKTTQKLNENL